MAIVYMATNKVNGKQYVGQSWRTLHERRVQHQCKYWAKRSALTRAIVKYGKDNFRWEVLHHGILLQEELDRLERHEIQKRKTMTPLGYNIASGGGAGQFMSAEWRARNKEAIKRQSYAVICVETGEHFESGKAAIRKCGGGVWSALKDASRTAGGYHWTYESPELARRSLARMREKTAEAERRKREKECVCQRLNDTRKRQRKEKMSSGWHAEVRKRREEAAARRDEKQRLIGSIGVVAYRERQRIKAQEAALALASTPEWREKWEARCPEYGDVVALLPERCKPKQVVRVEDGIVFRSTRAAGIAVNTDANGIRIAIRRNRACRGYHWRYADE